ncbi:MAG: hypothetical protein ABUT39_15545 [Acidobacteriota bacterium]
MYQAALRRQDFHFELVAPTGASPSTYPVILEQSGLSPDILLSLLAPSQVLRDRVLNMLSILSEPGSDLSSLLGTMLETSVDWNAASAVVTLEYRGVRVLFGGDANAITWKEILRRLGNSNYLECDVAIAWHHGARLGVVGGQDYDQVAWKRVLRQSPEGQSHVLVSHGCGRYGHPHSETIEAVTNNGGMIYCTQLRKAGKRFEVEDESFAELGGLGAGWDGESVEVFTVDENACCGNINVNISHAGMIDLNCDGPGLSREGGFPEFCCLSNAEEVT